MVHLYSKMDAFKIITSNVNGIRLPTKLGALFTSLCQTKADFIFLQETHSTSSDKQIWKSEWGGHGRANSKGVAILFKRNININITGVILDAEGRYIIAQLPWGDESLTLINIYAPTSSDQAAQSNLMNNLHTKMDNSEIFNIVMGGDFNTQLDSPANSRATPQRIRGTVTRLLPGRHLEKEKSI